MISQENNSDVSAFKDLRVMVIDDSKTILRSAEIILSKQGCSVLTVENGFESLSRIAEFNPDIIFVDIMMPRLDGYQTCALIKSNQEFADTPIIMLSSKDNLFDKARGRLAGSDKYLTKPFNSDDILNAIRDYLPEQEQKSSQGSSTHGLMPEFVDFETDFVD